MSHTHTHIYKGIYHKEFVHAIMELDKSKVCTVNWQTRDPGKLIFISVQVQRQGKNQCSSLKAEQEERSLIQGRVSLPIIVRPSAVWMRATHIRKGNLLFFFFNSVYQVFISSKNTLPSTPGKKVSRQAFGQSSWPRQVNTYNQPSQSKTGQDEDHNAQEPQYLKAIRREWEEKRQQRNGQRGSET